MRFKPGVHVCYVDGSCKKLEGAPGGWGVVVKSPDGRITENFGFATKTTIGAMELTAISEALKILPDGASATVFSDSKSALHYCSEQLPKWRKNRWKNCDLTDTALLKKIDSLLSDKKLSIQWTWIRGHNGNPGNERANALAAQGARRAKVELKICPDD